jgi:dienelactone hydrolase
MSAAPERLPYADEGVRLIGELYRPKADPNGRAALLLHEADGIGGNVRRHAAMLADLGYVALCADLHGDGRVLSAAEASARVAEVRAEPQPLRRRVRAGLAALSDATGVPPRQIVVLGYCFGGYAALELARDGAEVAAVTSFHGILTTQAPAVPGAIRSPVLACTGALDPLVPPADVAAFGAEMTQAEADWQLISYGCARHAFTVESLAGSADPKMRYDPAADRQSWAAMLAFFEEVFASG